MKKVNHMLYQIKVALKYNKRIHRLIQICGCDTLDDLSDAILESIGFDHEHLYLFNMENRKYGSNSYQSMTQAGGNSTNIRLDQLAFYPSQKFLYLYDFGDEWWFELTVQKAVEDSEYRPPVVVKEVGELVQYPDWEEEDGEEEEAENFFVVNICEDLTVEEILGELEDGYVEDQYDMLFYQELQGEEAIPVAAMRAQIAREVAENPEGMCWFLPNTLLQYIMDLTSGSEEQIPYDMCELMKLYSYGYLRVSASDYGMVIELPKEVVDGYSHYFGIPANLKTVRKNGELEAIATYLVSRYGLIELENFYPILNYSAKRKLTYEEFLFFVNSHLHYWGRFTIQEDEGGTAFITCLKESAAGLRKQRRETEEWKRITYPVFTWNHCEQAISNGYFQEYPAYAKMLQALKMLLRLPETAMSEMMEMLATAVLEGHEIQATKKEVKKRYNEYGCNFTKRVQQIIEDLYQSLPRAVWKGWSQEELGQTGCIRAGMYDSLETARKEEISSRKKRSKDTDKPEDYDQLSLF